MRQVRIKVVKIVTMLLLWLLFAAQTSAEPSCTLAAASDLIPVMADLKSAFAKEHPQTQVKVSFGSSGNFFAQIRNGAPLDLFLSADTNYPSMLIKYGSGDPDSLTLYAIGHLVLWTSTSNLPISTNLSALVTNAGISRIALPNPSHSPYGRAAKSALEHLGLWSSLQHKLVLGENAAQAMQFAQSGHAQVSMLPLSMAQNRPEGSGNFVKIPPEWHPPIHQAGVLTTQGSQNPVARQFLAFLVSQSGKQIFASHGFSLPD